MNTRGMIKSRAVRDVKMLDIYTCTFSLPRSIIIHSMKSSSRERSHVMWGSLTFGNSRSGSHLVTCLLNPICYKPGSELATRCYNFHIMPFRVKLTPPGFLVDCFFTFSFFDTFFFCLPLQVFVVGLGFFAELFLYILTFFLGVRGKCQILIHVYDHNIIKNKIIKFIIPKLGTGNRK